MASIPRYEGNHEQVYGEHPLGEPMSRSYDVVRPAPEHAAHLSSSESGLTSYPVAACVEPLAPVNTDQQDVAEVHVKFL
jgi:hypothetical protein